MANMVRNIAELLWPSGGSDKVKLETMATIKSIPWSETSTDFPVLVRVTAPQEFTQRPSVDLVAVLDTSGSMLGERLESMKQAMVFVIDNLGPDDRLSIVPFNSNHLQFNTTLSVMSEENREEAKTRVNSLQASGGDDLNSVNEAAAILRQRGPEKSSRIGRIIYLSDGSYTVESLKGVNSEFPANTFGLGADHSPKALQYIANKTSGVYSYVNQNLDKIKDAFAQSIGGLTSVTAIDLKIKLQTHEGVSITSIESGSYEKSFDKQTGTIKVNDLYAGEKKNFIVFLTIPKGKEKLMAVSGSYKNPETSEMTSTQLRGSQVVVKRPKEGTPSDVVQPEVAAELARLELVNGVSALANDHHFDKNKLQTLWDGIRNSVNGRKALEPTMSDLGKGVAVMKEEGEPFLLSWLTSHLWQRATTKGSPSESGDFQTNRMAIMITKVDNPIPVPEPKHKPKGKAKVMWDGVVSWARSNPYSCALVVLLLLAALLLLMLYVGRPTPPGPNPLAPKPDPVILLDISQHAGWPKMQKALEMTMVKKIEEHDGIASFLHSASIENMSLTMNRYLYLALLHASVLGSRCKPEDVGTISLLEQKVESLQAERNELLAKCEALAKEKEELALSTESCTGSKEKDEALERANTRIAELERQFQDKKAFADSLLSEVANADAHLKTCGQRVDMLESKVREMEGVIVSE